MRVTRSELARLARPASRASLEVLAFARLVEAAFASRAVAEEWSLASAVQWSMGREPEPLVPRHRPRESRKLQQRLQRKTNASNPPEHAKSHERHGRSWLLQGQARARYFTRSAVI